MRLFPEELDIGSDEGFLPERDIFNRKQFADQLTNIVRSLEGPAVLLLDAPWGTGKTTFVRMWQGELNHTKIPNIYFDSFANDYHEDAFLSLAAEVFAKAQDLKPKNKRALNQFKKSAINVAKILGRASLRMGVRIGTAGVLTGLELEEGAKAVSEAAASVGEEAAKSVDEFSALLTERLESHRADKGAFQQFAEALGALAHSLTDANSNSGNAAPLIFIIDELDRCRPSFALELLEKVKHFFSVDGVVFVLVTNLKQLESAVRVTYGDIDAGRYLEKFYHLRFSLPARGDENLKLNHVRVYTQYVLGSVIKPNHGLQDLDQFILATSQYHQISLRTLERILTYVGIVLASTGDRHLLPTPVVAGLCVLKVMAPELYSDALNRRLRYEDIEEFFRFSNWRSEHNLDEPSRFAGFAADWWKYTTGERLDDQTFQRFEQGLWQYSFRRPTNIIGYLCELIEGMSFPNPG